MTFVQNNQDHVLKEMCFIQDLKSRLPVSELASALANCAPGPFC